MNKARVFDCPACKHVVAFTATACRNCGNTNFSQSVVRGNWGLCDGCGGTGERENWNDSGLNLTISRCQTCEGNGFRKYIVSIYVHCCLTSDELELQEKRELVDPKNFPEMVAANRHAAVSKRDQRLRQAWEDNMRKQSQVRTSAHKDNVKFALTMLPISAVLFIVVFVVSLVTLFFVEIPGSLVFSSLAGCGAAMLPLVLALYVAVRDWPKE